MDGYLYLAALGAVFLFSMFIAHNCWQKQIFAGSFWLAASMFSIALWVFFQALELLLPTTHWKYSMVIFMYIGIAFAPLFFCFFILDFYNFLNKIPKTLRTTLLMIPCITVLQVATNWQHHFFFSSTFHSPIGVFTFLSFGSNTGFWVHSIFSYLMVFGALVTLLWQYRYQSGRYRRQSLQMILSILLSSFINLFYILGFIHSNVDLTPFTFLLLGALFFHSFFFTNLMELGPITKNLLYQNITDGLFILAPDGTVIEYNDAFLKMFPAVPLKILGLNIIDLAPRLGIGMSFFNAAPSTQKEMIVSLPGNKSICQISKTDIRGLRYDLDGFLYLFKDITEAQNRLLEADRALKNALNAKESISRYLSDMSHEIRTPLIGILGATDLLLTTAQNTRQKQYARELYSGAYTLLDTLNRVLDYSKLEAGKMAMTEEHISLDGFIQLLSYPGLSLSFSSPHFDSLDPTLGFKANIHRIHQLGTLMQNFITKSLAESPELFLSYDHSLMKIQYTFVSNSAHTLELLHNYTQLETYLQLDWQPDPMLLMLALKLTAFLKGLFSCSIVEKHVQIIFQLPLETVFLKLPKQEASLLKSYHLLLVDDSIINQAVFKRMLKQSPHQLTCVSSAKEALVLSNTTSFDIIFTDIHMPGMTGIQLSYALQETINVVTPILALTADTDAESEQLIQASPIITTLFKPCNKETLLQAIAQYVVVK